jgi:hypothetical protein
VAHGGEVVDSLEITSAAHSRSEAARAIAGHLKGQTGDPKEKARLIVGQVLANADEQLQQVRTATGPTILEIIEAELPRSLRLTHRTEKGGIWCEAWELPIDQARYTNVLPQWLLRKAEQASYAPRDHMGRINRQALIKFIRAELGVSFSNLLERLPAMPEADLNKNTAAGRNWRMLMELIWLRTVLLEHTEHSNPPLPRSTSLAAKAKKRLEKTWSDYRTGQRQSWQPIHPHKSAWCRLQWTGTEDKPIVKQWLAMNWELAYQLNVAQLPGVRDQKSLIKLGTAFGLIEPDAPEGIPDRYAGGHTLAILTQELTKHLFDSPEDDSYSGEKRNDAPEDDGKASDSVKQEHLH